MAIAEKVSGADVGDVRVWLNANEIASGLRRAPSTVYDVLAELSDNSKRVGRERRYAWNVAFHLARRYAVPFDELAIGVRSALEERARTVGADEEELWKLFAQAYRTWAETGSDHVEWSVATRANSTRRGAEPLFARALAAIRQGRTPRITSRISGDPEALLQLRRREEQILPLATKLSTAFSESTVSHDARRPGFRGRGRGSRS